MRPIYFDVRLEYVLIFDRLPLSSITPHSNGSDWVYYPEKDTRVEKENDKHGPKFPHHSSKHRGIDSSYTESNLERAIRRETLASLAWGQPRIAKRK